MIDMFKANWVYPIGIFCFFLVLKYVFKNIIFVILRKLVQRTETELDDKILGAIESPIQFILTSLGLYYFIKYSPINMIFARFNEIAVYNSFFWIASCWFFYNIADSAHKVLMKFVRLLGIRFTRELTDISLIFVKMLIVATGLFAIAHEWECDLNGFIAGLGLGGLAIALAAKDALSNIFGGIVIITDRPFSVGDWVKVNEEEGIVEQLSFRSTRIRKFDQTLVYIPNAVLINAAIVNWTKQKKRRIRFRIRLAYTTTPDQIELLIDEITKFFGRLESENKLYHEKQSITFDSFGENSLEVLVICHTPITEYYNFLRLQHEVNSTIMKIIKQNNISIALPNLGIVMRRQPAMDHQFLD